MEPTPVVPPLPARPPGNWLVRSGRAVFVERRLPTRAAQAWDRLCMSLGFPHKTVSVAGQRIEVRRLSSDVHFARDALVRQEYTPAGFDIHGGDTVIDIGGNIGGFALLAARRAPRGRVLTFEPVRANFDLLQRNLRRNRVGNVVAVQAAVLDRRGPVPIYLSSDSTGTHTVLESLAGDTRRFEEVEGVTLADVFETYGIKRCQFLKMNCEGAEYPILLNLPSELFRQIDTVVLQYHGTTAASKRSDAERLLAALEQAGYRIGFYTDIVGTERGFIGAQRSPPR